MWQVLRNAWKLPDLRKKLLYTLFILLVVRVGSLIPVPFVDTKAIGNWISSNSNTLLGLYSAFTGGALENGAIFALSIQPYINASIIMQLLCIAIPFLEKLQKEGPDGQKRIAKYTRFVTIAIAALLGFGYYRILVSSGAIANSSVFAAFVIIVTMVAGASIVMWLGEQINENGVGNGISLILFVGIVSRIPTIAYTYGAYLQANMLNWITLPLVILGILGALVFIVFMNDSERRIPIQYAKRMVGRKMYGGQSTHLPIKLNASGVMPIIFAQAIATIPVTIGAFLPPTEGSWWEKFLDAVGTTSWIYAIVYFLLIIFFNFFYTQMQFNPVEISNNLKKNGGFVPGIRPGRPTAQFISKVLGKITFVGAFFLGIIAVLPILISIMWKIDIGLGGTSLLIVVGVALETVTQIEAQMVMRNQKGFLE